MPYYTLLLKQHVRDVFYECWIRNPSTPPTPLLPPLSFTDEGGHKLLPESIQALLLQEKNAFITFMTFIVAFNLYDKKETC